MDGFVTTHDTVILSAPRMKTQGRGSAFGLFISGAACTQVMSVYDFVGIGVLQEAVSTITPLLLLYIL